VILLRSELYRVRPVILLFIVATSPHNTEDLLTIALIRVKERFSNTSDHSGPICFYTGRKVDTCDSLSSKTNQRSVKPCGKDCRPRATKSFSQRPGEDGFFLASNRVFDLIVLDVMLPGRDGLEVLAALRRQSFALKTPDHSVIPAGHENLVQTRYKQDSLWFLEAWHSSQPLARLQIDHFH